MFLGWFAAVGIGRLPHWVDEFVRAMVGYQARVTGYLYLLTDVYPQRPGNSKPATTASARPSTASKPQTELVAR